MRRIAILTYHSLDTSGSVVSMPPRIFADQMACIASLGFRGVSLREAVAGRTRGGCWPTASVVLTFDDGYANFYESAVPALTRHAFSATVFLVTSHVGGRNDWARPPRGLGAQAILSWQQVAELAATGFEIGAHTRTHPDLRRLSATAAAAEMVGARADIEAQVQGPVESFAYPFGGATPALREIAAREFRAACTTVLRRAGGDESWSLPRIDTYYARSPVALQRLLAGQLDGYLAVRRWGRRMRRLL